MQRTIEINGTQTEIPAGAVAYKHADPTEDARWISDEDEAWEIEQIDPSLIVWAEETEKYIVRGTASGWAVSLADGSRYAEFVDYDEAEEAASLLTKGEKDESDYDWVD